MSYPQTYGTPTVVFGNPATLTGYVVQSTGISNKCGINAEVFDETGRGVQRRYDDLVYEITLDALIQSTATLPLPGAEFTYNSIKYEILSVDVKTSNKDWNKITVKGKNSSQITLS